MLEAVRQAIDIVQIIGEVVALKKSGQNFFGLCPFHSEKSPSFSVSPSKQLFHCFGCKAGGDALKFLQLYHAWDFNQALEEAAKRAGIKLDRFKKDPQWEESIAILQASADFFSENLRSKSGQGFRDYLVRRSVPEDLWESFRLGAHLGAHSSHQLANFLHQKSFNRDLASQLGLLSRMPSGDFVDRFQGRLLFPILDEKGTVKGFGARSLGDEQPKYLNSPKSKIFDKSRLFYGMHLASKAASRKGYLVIVEGYMDVLALMQYGVTNVVGSMGTSLTTEQVRLAKRWAQKAVSLFDSDAAGLAATERNLALFFREGVEAKVALIPTGKDPDAFLNDSSKDLTTKRNELRKVFESARSALDYLVESKVLTAKSPTAKGKEIRGLVDLMNQIPDEIQKTVLKRDIAQRFGLPEGLVLQEPVLTAARPTPPSGSKALALKNEPSRADDKYEREIVKFLVQSGDLDDFNFRDLRALVNGQSKWGEMLVRLLDLGLNSKDIAGLEWLSKLQVESGPWADERSSESSDKTGNKPSDNMPSQLVEIQIREWAVEGRSEVSSDEVAKKIWGDLIAGLKRAFVKRESEKLQNDLLLAEQQNDTEGARRILSEKQDLRRLFSGTLDQASKEL